VMFEPQSKSHVNAWFCFLLRSSSHTRRSVLQITNSKVI
jgi:hypothetical protein